MDRKGLVSRNSTSLVSVVTHAYTVLWGRQLLPQSTGEVPRGL